MKKLTEPTGPTTLDEAAVPAKKSPTPMDPMLRQAARVDRLLSEMTPSARIWAIHWLNSKWLNQPPSTEKENGQ